jgi:hypothetical protein
MVADGNDQNMPLNNLTKGRKYLEVFGLKYRAIPRTPFVAKREGVVMPPGELIAEIAVR